MVMAEVHNTFGETHPYWLHPSIETRTPSGRHDDFDFDATLQLARESWSASALLRALARHPWMTGKVMAAIDGQALRLWVRGLPVFTHPKQLARKEAS